MVVAQFFSLAPSLPFFGSSACVMCMRVSDARFFGSGLLFEQCPINSARESWFVCLCMLALIFPSYSFDCFVVFCRCFKYGCGLWGCAVGNNAYSNGSGKM